MQNWDLASGNWKLSQALPPDVGSYIALLQT